jgi:NAD(P)-dependent dehydrogenase (short-subunit alcohol dehydrogenase family)
VAPGIMETPATAKILDNEMSRNGAMKQYPLPRIGDPLDLARLMAWLLSEQAAWVTGQCGRWTAGFRQCGHW